ncbi:hypothetical protein TCE0_060r19139 [Talaromyces pinophilus]|uniref:NAD-dependent epimerase/dehydratase domain-containing protein n=1 Tax=Talaromyces pinophilus TaxID=128442 RepID=A0A6V8HPH5_TALPI|nr:hypothetical protein TCE0_060r19139 [Talaromyces pinophilus]
MDVKRSRIQRIVLTSSCAAILDTSDTAVTVSEEDWNDQRVLECNKFGRSAAGLSKYSASKTLAERAAWDFWDANKDRLKWDISVINPPYIFGPILHEVESPENLKSSTKYFYDAIVRNEFVGLPPTRRPGHGYVDVRDVAAAHIKALQTPGAGGERIIVSAGSWVWQDAINAAIAVGEPLYKLHPATVSQDDIPTRFITFDTRKQAKILGLELRSMEDIVHDVLVDYSKRGWIP